MQTEVLFLSLSGSGGATEYLQQGLTSNDGRNEQVGVLRRV